MSNNRIAIVDVEKCKPTKCKKECIKFCPPQSGGKEVIKIIDIEDISNLDNKSLISKITDKKKIAQIIESQCIGCNICVSKCPFNAIKIVNLPFENKAEIIHRYGPNGFRLYRLPSLKSNCVIGIIGENGVGKTTLINILSKNIVPNFESEITQNMRSLISKFRGSVLYNYLKVLYENKLIISIKPQKIKSVLENVSVKKFMETCIMVDNYDYIVKKLELNNLMEKQLENLSGGELQRVLCAKTICSKSDVYIFDEPSNYLDIKQRLTVTQLIRELANTNKYVIIIDHDLAMMDYMVDEIFIIYGKPGAFGIVSKPMTTLEGINVYLDGYIPSENVRFRSDEFNLKTTQDLDSSKILNNESNGLKYLGGCVEYPNFTLNIPPSSIKLLNSINIILGENGTGKTTFINYLSKTLEIGVSYKEQTLSIEKFKNNYDYPTVSELMYKYILSSYTDSTFRSEVVKPLEIDEIENRKLNELSSGELQRVLMILCLGTPASVYLIDEPSANLDIEKRITMIKVIKRFIMNNHKCAFIIEHDIMMAVSFAQEITSSILLIDKKPNETSTGFINTVSDYMDFSEGINKFLQQLDITMRIAGHNRPRINKINSQLDKQQREINKYYM